MISIAVNSQFDIFMDSSRSLAMVREKDACQQDCLLASQMLLGEFPYDTNQGVSYMESLFRNKNPYAFEESMKQNLLTVPNVTAVTAFRIVQIGDELEYAATIETSFGTVNI